MDELLFDFDFFFPPAAFTLGHWSMVWHVEEHLVQVIGVVEQRLMLCPMPLQYEQIGGIHGLEVKILKISPVENFTLTNSGSGFCGSMIVSTLATSKFVKLAVEG